MIGTNRLPPKNDSHSGNFTLWNLLYRRPAVIPDTIPPNTPISNLSFVAPKTATNTNCAMAPANAAAPLVSTAKPIAIPIAKISGKLPKIALPAASIIAATV